MFDFTSRTELLLGAEALERLCSAFVAVVGIGGVGGACAEALVRSGVGKMLIIDSDTVDITNINRQIIATHKNIGKKKTEIAAERFFEINPELSLTAETLFLTPENADILFDRRPDFVVDAIDTVSSKLFLASECQARGIPIISSLGTGNRVDPTSFKIGHIEDTAGCGCGLARVMRSECKKRGVVGLSVLYSTEMPKKAIVGSENGRHSPASVSFCPPVAGYIIASEVVKRIIK